MYFSGGKKESQNLYGLPPIHFISMEQQELQQRQSANPARQREASPPERPPLVAAQSSYIVAERPPYIGAARPPYIVYSGGAASGSAERRVAAGRGSTGGLFIVI